MKVKRKDVTLLLALFSTLASLLGVGIGLAARNDVVAASRYNTAIVSCQSSTELYRRFFLKLIASPQVPFEQYYPGEVTTFERTKVELIDVLNALAYSSKEFEEVVNEYIAKVSHYTRPIESPFLGNSEFDFAKLWQYIRDDSDLAALSVFPGKLHDTCNRVLDRIRS